MRLDPAKLTPAVLAEIQRAEAAAQLPKTERKGKEMTRPTVEFLKTLGGILARHFRRPCDPSQAWQAWIAIGAIRQRARLAARESAELSYWYGFDCTRLPVSRQVALALNLPRVLSQHRLINQLYDPTDYEGVYELTLAAYDDEARALKARSDAMRALIEATRK